MRVRNEFSSANAGAPSVHGVIAGTGVPALVTRPGNDSGGEGNLIRTEDHEQLLFHNAADRICKNRVIAGNS
jgi:hypothetical protein